jgi:hypothetical protein
MRFTAGFLSGVLIGCWVGAVAAVMVLETIGRAVELPGKVRVPDEVPEAWSVTW